MYTLYAIWVRSESLVAMGEENTLDYNVEPLKSFHDIRRFYSNLVKILLAKGCIYITWQQLLAHYVFWQKPWRYTAYIPSHSFMKVLNSHESTWILLLQHYSNKTPIYDSYCSLSNPEVWLMIQACITRLSPPCDGVWAWDYNPL